MQDICRSQLVPRKVFIFINLNKLYYSLADGCICNWFGRIRMFLKCLSKSDTMEFFLNEAELSLNSVNSANSGNLINHWSLNWADFKDVCLAGAVVASWSLTQEVAGSSPFTVMINIFVTEFTEFSENI